MDCETDLSRLGVLDEATILTHLKRRYYSDEYYTFLGDVLVAINPNKTLEIYGDQHHRLYELSSSVRETAETPHIFWTAQQSFERLMASKKNQCILVGGESGTGKTESTKLFLNHVSFLCNTNSDKLHEKITRVNPLLESFGNAVTPMNANSSRFGKLIELHINEQGHLRGARIRDYMLEKSRVVSQGSSERNFHILDCMFAGLTRDQRICYNLTNVGDYRILRHGRAPAFSRRSFKEMKTTYTQLIELMRTIGFDDDDISTILTVLSAIFHLTSITFVNVSDDTDGVEIAENNTLETAANLLGVNDFHLQDALISNTMSVRGETVKSLKKQHQAEDARDALAKTLYSRLFGWIVGQINVHLQPERADSSQASDVRTLSILDFAGFERLHQNRFDQLCINTANERLHQYLYRHIFALEQADLVAEGVDADLVQYKDNQPLIDLFFKKPQGLFHLLDEESNFPQATDQSLVTKLDANYANSQGYLPCRGNPQAFTIVHYAGQVLYDSRGMLERNRDSLSDDITEVMLGSESDMVRLLFSTKGHATGSYSRSFSACKMRPKLYSIPQPGSRKLSGVDDSEINAAFRAKQSRIKEIAAVGRGKSYVSRYFRKSLGELIEKLEDSQPWFVRCIRPNSQSKPGIFDDELVAAQLRYNGLLEIARIRRDGFPVRQTIDDFVQTYRDICFERSYRLAKTREEAEQILKCCCRSGYAFCHSKVFLKLEQSKAVGRALVKWREAIRRQEGERRRKAEEEERKKAELLKAELRKKMRAAGDKIDIEKTEKSVSFSPIDVPDFGGHTAEVPLDEDKAHRKVTDWIEMNDEAGPAPPPSPPLDIDSHATVHLPEVDKMTEYDDFNNSPLLDRSQWDRFQMVPRDGHQDHPSFHPGVKAFKVVCYSIFFFIILGAALLNKLPMLTLTSGIVKNNEETFSDPRPTMILIALCFPYACNAFVYGSRSLFGSTGWPSLKMMFAMLAIEFIHTAGLCLLVFRVLPRVDMMRAIILMTSIYSGPSVMMTLSVLRRCFDGCCAKTVKIFIGILCAGIQVASIVTCSYGKFVLTSDDVKTLRTQAFALNLNETLTRSEPETSEFLWELPTSLILISLSFWENFIEGDLRFCSLALSFSTWKKSVHLVRQRLYIFLSLWKIGWSVLLTVLLVDKFSFSLTFPQVQDDQGWSDAQIHLIQYGPLYICLVAPVFCTYFGGLACKLSMQRISFSLAVCLVTPLSMLAIILRCRLGMLFIEADCYRWVCPESWSDLLPYHWSLLAATWISQCLLLAHIWQSKSERMAKIEKLFITPIRCAVLTEQTVMLRRRTPNIERTLQKGLEENRFYPRSINDTVPQIYACATMWHETRSEMTKLLKSIFRMDIDHSARAIAQKYYKIKDPDYYEFEAHIFFDDAFELTEDDKAVPNSFVLRLMECLDEAISSVHERPATMSPPQKTPTPYGGRLTWILPGGTNLVVHLKDKSKIRNRKRWSQVMYLYYLMGYNLLANNDMPYEDETESADHVTNKSGDKFRLSAAQLRKRRQSAFFPRSVIFNYVTEDAQRKVYARNTISVGADLGNNTDGGGTSGDGFEVKAGRYTGSAHLEVYLGAEGFCVIVSIGGFR